ncbi:mismatch-specific DNA-glycosylase [Coralloluteibacterium thermophilus]|uniref:Mismatch-specific DNA-glycosylase n=1 Tax=Coralloluteibacterium thermophilum TaxID=2707049 RepID=A0ABV9NE97_9GAMM
MPPAATRHPDVAAGLRRPTPAELEAARGLGLDDLVAPGLAVLFCGINPGLYSAATGRHFARPGNRFWPALHASGFTPTRFSPFENERLPALGLGITNMVARTTARADELAAAEYVAGAARLRRLLRTTRPGWLAVVGLGAWRSATGARDAQVGPQPEPFEGTRVWLLPSPSGLNAHWQPVALAAEFARLREAAGLPDRRR